VDQLEGDAVPGRADVEDVAAHRREGRPHCREVVRLGPDHEQQGALVGLLRGPAHGGIDHPQAPLAQRQADPPGGGRVDRAAVRDDSARPRAGCDAIRAEGGGFHVWAVWEHREDDLRPLRDGPRRLDALGAERLEGLDRGQVRIVDGQREAARQEVLAHAATHRAEPDQADSLLHAASGRGEWPPRSSSWSEGYLAGLAGRLCRWVTAGLHDCRAGEDDSPR
jgi:hypothetical protein